MLSFLDRDQEVEFHDFFFVFLKLANFTNFPCCHLNFLVQKPGLFTNFRYQTNTTNTMLGTIVSIQPKDSSNSGGETRESVVYHLATDMLDKLPKDYVPHLVGVGTV